MRRVVNARLLYLSLFSVWFVSVVHLSALLRLNVTSLVVIAEPTSSVLFDWPLITDCFLCPYSSAMLKCFVHFLDSTLWLPTLCSPVGIRSAWSASYPINERISISKSYTMVWKVSQILNHFQIQNPTALRCYMKSSLSVSLSHSLSLPLVEVIQMWISSSIPGSYSH